MVKKIYLLGIIFMLMLFFSCATTTSTTQIITPNNDKAPNTMALDYRDFEKAAAEAVKSMLQSGALDRKDGGRYVLAISRIINDTMQRIDTDQFIKKIRVELLKSGKVVVTTAVGLTGPEDVMVNKVRKLRKSKEFNKRTVVKQGQLIAPDLSLSGKIIQRNVKLDNGLQQVEYYFQLTLTDLKTGLAFWEGETFIGKRGTNKSVAW